MAVRDVAYVEMYVEDEEASLDYLVTSFGFRVAASASAAGLRSALLRQGEVRLVLTTGPGTDAFLAAHGEGVADIAFACDDAADLLDRATAAGGCHPGTGGPPALRGFGDVRHTLIGPAVPSAGGLADGRAWRPAQPPARPGHGRIGRLDHVAVCAGPGGLGELAEHYRELGFEQFYREYIQVGQQAMDSLVIRSGGAVFTILQPDPAREAGQIGEFLARNGGAGVQHLAFQVTGIAAAVRQFRDQGVQFLTVPGTYYDLLAARIPALRGEIDALRDAHVLADQDEWGCLLQLFTRSPYPRSTLFYELIERRGAKGFGSANIRALYEAVERERTAVTRPGP